MGPEVQHYPFLTVDEWSGVCTSFVTACQSSIGESDGWSAPTHRKQHGVDTLRITRTFVRASEGPTDGEERPADAISNCGSAFEESDEEVAILPQKQPKQHERTVVVTYEILLSSSYLVPILYFTVATPAGALITDLASIYADVVPSALGGQVSGVGVIGAISMTDHPVTGLPSFFVHPCNTADSLRQVAVDKSVLVSEYLFLWMGVIPPAVGLSIPAMALQRKSLG